MRRPSPATTAPSLAGSAGEPSQDEQADDLGPYVERGVAGGRRFDRSRLRLGVVIAVVCGALAFLLMQGLGNATTYFRNADEAVAERQAIGTRRFRLQGTVVPGSVRQSGDDVAFDVEFHCAIVAVSHRGAPPELFADGIPVVLEGAYRAGTDTYASERIFVRHTAEYRTEEADLLALAAKEAC